MTGGPLAASEMDELLEETETDVPVLYPWMKLGWFTKFGMLAILCTALFFVAIAMSEIGAALLFLGLGIVSWALVIFMATHR